MKAWERGHLGIGEDQLVIEGRGKQSLQYQRRCHYTSSRGSIYTSCSIFPAFTITLPPAQNHDASLLVLQSSVDDLQGLVTGAERFPRAGGQGAKGPRGQGAGAPNHGVGLLSSKPSAQLLQLLVNFSRRASRPERLLQQQPFTIYLHSSPSLALHPRK
jgi:hypothetical protein